MADGEGRRLGALVTALWSGRETPPGGAGEPAAGETLIAYVAARSGGRRVGEAWGEGSTREGALAAAICALRAGVDAGGHARVDVLQVDLVDRFVPLTRDGAARALTNVHRGLRGLEIRRGEVVERHAPSAMIASNRSYRRLVERFLERHGPGRFELRVFGATQWLVPVQRPGETVRMYRGNRVLPVEEMNRGLVVRVAELQSQWMFANLMPDGRMVYKYWPSAGRESAANNMIRQWMGTVALGCIARRGADPLRMVRVEANIRYNLEHFYEERDGLGCIVENGAAIKLGAVALAALALLEHPGPTRHERELQALCRTVDHLWCPDGSFVTFLEPPGRNDNQNFYPGEALLLWASLYARAPEARLLERFMASVRYYRAWHLGNRNPAFIPWHTRACRRMWSVTGDGELARWILEMNDWLLPVQQWDSVARFPDTRGRFHDPARPFGPPHASSTGVYLEGLIDAWRVARALGEDARRERYRQAIVRGLRSLAQLTFRDEVDMFYVARRRCVLGGVRTTVYNNEIRVDNVQHGLMAMLEILDTLPAEDFRP